eukprot:s215_g19.t1
MVALKALQSLMLPTSTSSLSSSVGRPFSSGWTVRTGCALVNACQTQSRNRGQVDMTIRKSSAADYPTQQCWSSQGSNRFLA